MLVDVASSKGGQSGVDGCDHITQVLSSLSDLQSSWPSHLRPGPDSSASTAHVSSIANRSCNNCTGGLLVISGRDKSYPVLTSTYTYSEKAPISQVVL